MKLLKIAAAVLIAGLAFPIAANASTYWLLIGGGKSGVTGDFATLPMSSMEECEAAGKKVFDLRGTPNGIHGATHKSIRYVCLKGK